MAVAQWRSGNLGLNLRGQVSQRRACQDDGIPRLRIATRRRTLRLGENAFEYGLIHGFIQKLPDRAP
jgi:hypothetical protein